MDKLLEYFAGDELAASVWKGKYAIKGEETPLDMHVRMAKEFARIEAKYIYKERKMLDEGVDLSDFGRDFIIDLAKLDEEGIACLIAQYFKGFENIVPQGSIMSALGNFNKIQSLSNCFVIPPPYDSYGGIFKTDEQIAQLEKRRGGVGTNINTLRPEETVVSNAAGTSTGAHSFMSRYSNTTREVAQNGRRGALMLLMSCLHPDIFKFVTKKKDRTQVTGANISSMLTDKFILAAENDDDFICRFPIDTEIVSGSTEGIEYNKLYTNPSNSKIQYMKIHAKELFDLIVEMAHENAEPGVAFIDRIKNYCPEGVYPQFLPIASNPCGEQWMQAYDACRLLAANLYNMIVNHFTKEATLDLNKVYEMFYIQQRLADDIVDLEIEYIQRIIDKIESDKEPEEVKITELTLWKNIQDTARASRRTGCGFTALGDMLAALSLKYDSDESLRTIEILMKTKIRAELDCTIDLAILRGTFEGWDKEFEFTEDSGLHGNNDFYQMLVNEFPEQAYRMNKYGRRNISWSTVAPTGSVSILTRTTSGLEPLFLPYYMRRKKVNPSDKNARIDFKDSNGDCWQEYPILHPKFKDWINSKWKFASIDHTSFNIEDCNKEDIEKMFKESPWYKSCANDIAWEKRIEIQSIIQKYTTNAISSTINLPKDVSIETVKSIYMYAWELGLKGITIYRDGCRDGVLISDTQNKNNEFAYKDAIKRPKILDGEIYDVRVRGELYNVIVGLLDGKPYEVFVQKGHNTEELENIKIIKGNKGKYNIKYTIEGQEENEKNIASDMTDEEAVITRLISTALRHGADVKFLVEQLNKTNGDMTSFSKAIARTLKHFIPEGSMSTVNCQECGSNNVVFEEGCSTCKNCGNSKCS